MEYKLAPYFLSLFLMISLPSILSAQSLEEIDTIYVQTTRIPLKATETGRNISVIEGQDIQKMAFTSLDDLFRYIPGLEVQSRNAFGAQGDITMRGATFSQVLVLVDGMKLNDPLTAHFNSNIPVTPAEIERIEVLRGAASALYGADAVGGVINIITKGYNNKQEAETRAEGQVNYGQHRLVNAQQGFSIRKDKLYVGGGFSMNQSDGEFISEKILEDATLEGYNNFFDEDYQDILGAPMPGRWVMGECGLNCKWAGHQTSVPISAHWASSMKSCGVPFHLPTSDLPHQCLLAIPMATKDYRCLFPLLFL